MAYRDIANTPTVDRISGNFGTFVSTLTFAATATAGNLLTLIYRGNGAATQPTGWLIAATATDTASSLVTTLYYRVSDGSETSIDVQQSVSGGWWAEYTEYEGPWAASPLDVFSSQSAAADFDGSLDLGPLTPTQTDTLAIAVASHQNGAAIVNSIDESYTITEQHFGNAGGSGASFIAHKNLGAIAETSPTITWGGTPKAVGVLAVFMQEPGAPTPIDDITFDVDEWIGLPEGDHTLEAEDDGGTASLLVAYELPAGWVQSSASTATDELKAHFLTKYGITVEDADYVAEAANNAFRLLDTSASQWTTETNFVLIVVAGNNRLYKGSAEVSFSVPSTPIATTYQAFINSIECPFVSRVGDLFTFTVPAGVKALASTSYATLFSYTL